MLIDETRGRFEDRARNGCPPRVITSIEVFEMVKFSHCDSSETRFENTLAVESKSGKWGARFVPDYRFHNCPHFLQRSDLRDLSLENVKNVVRYPDFKPKLKKRPLHGGHVCMFEKTVDGATLKVVAEIKDSDCWLITSYESH